MTNDIDPTTVKKGACYRVSDPDSAYDGHTGCVLAVYTGRLVLELSEASPVAHVRSFELDQLEPTGDQKP